MTNTVATLAIYLKQESDLNSFLRLQQLGILQALLPLVSELSSQELLTYTLVCLLYATKFRMFASLPLYRWPGVFVVFDDSNRWLFHLPLEQPRTKQCC